MSNCFVPARLLLPRAGSDMSRWACIACDQFTQNRAYWEAADSMVGSTPSALRLMLPEVWLGETDARIPGIRTAMRRYLDEGILQPAFESGFILTERRTDSGSRLGLVGCIDLDQYSFEDDTAAIRPTEQTIRERIPPRLKIREGAALEMSHVLLLADDPAETLIAPLYAQRKTLPCDYDAELMLGGGHIRGWAVTGELADGLQPVLDALQEKGRGLLFTVGDGNHSLATAKAHWEKIRAGLSAEEAAAHPARCAMVEVVNIHDTALRFLPIHRVLLNVNAAELLRDWKAEFGNAPGDIRLISPEGEASAAVPAGTLAVQRVQSFLDAWLKVHPNVELDFVHEEETVREIVSRPYTAGILLPPVDKHSFFDILQDIGVMPRKTFSLGEGFEKRYYMECRSLEAEA